MLDIPGIAAVPVAKFFAAEVPGGDLPLEFELIAGGRSNLTYRVTDAVGRSWVARRPPLGHLLPSAHDVVREILDAERMKRQRQTGLIPFVRELMN